MVDDVDGRPVRTFCTRHNAWFDYPHDCDLESTPPDRRKPPRKPPRGSKPPSNDDSSVSAPKAMGLIVKWLFQKLFKFFKNILRNSALKTAQEMEKKHPGWKADLPSCPCTIQQARNNDTDWEEDGFFKRFLLRLFHPNAKFAIRSSKEYVNRHKKEGFSPGQQCTYDKNGNLITGGKAAGTPDSNSPNSSTLKHFIKDVWPHLILGSETYNLYWIPNNGQDCDENEL